MSSHRLQKSWKARLKAAVPFGLGQTKPPEGNVIVQRGVIEPAGGVPDYNAVVRVERSSKH